MTELCIKGTVLQSVVINVVNRVWATTLLGWQALLVKFVIRPWPVRVLTQVVV